MRSFTLVLVACYALTAAACTAPLPPRRADPITIVPPRRTPAPTPTFTVTPVPTQTPLPTPTAVFPAGCPGFRNTSTLSDDNLLTLYWEYMLSRGRELWNKTAQTYGRDPDNGDQMASLTGHEILAASRANWERAPEGRSRCGDLARFLVTEGKMAERLLR